jgi:hypothetical protein
MSDSLLETIQGVADVRRWYLNTDPAEHIKRHRSPYNTMDRWIKNGDIEKRLLQIEAELNRLEELRVHKNS